MSDETAGPEQVGSVAEEAAKLFEALQGWGAQAGAQAGAAGEGWGAHLSDLGEHVATGSAECTYCPLCRAIALVRQTSPEVRHHLTEAATSLLQAGAAFLESRAARADGTAPDRSSAVERIDLDEDGAGWDAD